MEDNENIHIDQLNHGNYPEPDVPAEQAWGQMKNLLQHVPVHTSASKGISLGKGMKLLLTKPILFGVPALIVVSSVAWYLTTNKIKSRANTINYRSQNIPLKETLPNNIILYLDSYSNIEVTSNANGENNLSITGAAYIETPGTEPRAVQIEAGKLSILPTQAKIYVSFDSASATSLVQVQTGKAVLKTSNATITLVAGMSAKYDERTGQFDQQQKLNVNTFGYATHSFEFSNTLLRDAARDIEKAYSISIKFSNPALSNCRLTTRFDNQPLKEVLDIMAYTLNIEYTFDQKNNLVVFKGDGCK